MVQDVEEQALAKEEVDKSQLEEEGRVLALAEVVEDVETKTDEVDESQL